MGHFAGTDVLRQLVTGSRWCVVRQNFQSNEIGFLKGQG